MEVGLTSYVLGGNISHSLSLLLSPICASLPLEILFLTSCVYVWLSPWGGRLPNVCLHLHPPSCVRLSSQPRPCSILLIFHGPAEMSCTLKRSFEVPQPVSDLLSSFSRHCWVFVVCQVLCWPLVSRTVKVSTHVVLTWPLLNVIPSCVLITFSVPPA